MKVRGLTTKMTIIDEITEVPKNIFDGLTAGSPPVTEEEKRFAHVLGVVMKTFPTGRPAWFSMADRIMSSPERCDYCQCCGNDCCNSRKCKRCIRAKTEKIP